MGLKSIALAALAIVLSSSLNAATVFQATDGDFNISDTTVGGQFAIFDNEAALINGTPLIEIELGDRIIVDGIPPALTTSLTNSRTSELIEITGGNFVFGATTSNGSLWILGEGTELYYGGSNQWSISFGDIGPALKVVVDIQAVPIPPSVWLFGSGLVGLVGVARRNKA